MAENVDLNIRVGMRDNASRPLKGFESSVIRTVGAISAALATLKTVLFPIVSAAKFERAMADVAKTTGYADQDIKRLSGSLVTMSKELGTSAVELANIAAIAGQLGLGNEGRASIEAFTESVARASVTLGLSVEAVAAGGAQISSIFGTAVGDVEKVFSTINELSNNSVASGTDLIDIMRRVGNTSQASLQDVAALAATARQVGVPNEQAGTGLVKFLGNLLAEGKKFSAAMGVTQSAWVRKVKDDSTAALKEVLAVLAEMESAESAALTKELFGSGRLYALASKLVGDAANDFAILNRMQRISNKGFEEGTSSVAEYERIMRTVVKQTDVLKASFAGLAIEAGDRVLPILVANIEKLSAALRDEEVIAYFQKLGEGLAGMIGSIGDAVRWVANLNVEWTNLGNWIKLFIQYKVAATLIGWAVGFGAVIKKVKILIAYMSTLGASVAAFTATSATASAAAGSAGLGGVLGSLFGNAQKSAGIAQKAITGTTKTVGILGKAMLGLRAAFAGLGAVVAFALGPVGQTLAIASVLFLTFKDEILEFLGFTDKTTAEYERLSAAANRKAAKAKADAYSDFEEFQKKIDTLFTEDGTAKAADRQVDYYVNLSTEDAIKDTQGLVKTFTELRNAVEAGDAAIEYMRGDLGKYKAAMDAAEVKVQELSASIKLMKDRVFAGSLKFDETAEKQLADMNKQLEAAQQKLAATNGQYDRASKSLVSYSESLIKAEAHLKDLTTPEIQRRFDQQTAAYAKLEGAVREARTTVKDLKKESEALAKLDVDADGYDPKRVKEVATQISIIQTKTDGWIAQQAKLREGMSGNQLMLANQVKAMSDPAIKDYADRISNLQFKYGDQIAQQMRENANVAVFNYIKLKNLKEGYELIGKAAESYAKKAKSAFNNTANEVIALNAKIAKFAVNFKTRFAELKMEIKIDSKLETLDDEYEERKAEIEKFYDARIAIADKSTAKYLTNKKKEKLADLENEHTKETANLKAANITERYNLLLERSKKLMQEANVAAKAGDIDKFFALKDKSKKDMDEALAVVSEAQELKSVNIFGKTSLKFTEAEITNMVSKATEVGKELGDGIKNANKSADKSASETAEKWAKASQGIVNAFEKAKGVVDNMRSTFSNFDEILNKAETVFKGAATGLQSTIRELNTAASNPYDAAQEIDVTDLSNQVRKGTVEGLDGFHVAVRESLSRGLLEASGAFKDVEMSVRPGAIVESVTAAVEAAQKTKPEIEVEAKTDPVAIKKHLLKIQGLELNIEKAHLKTLVGPTGKTIEQRARGGYISGPGSGTSDSIPAWLSNGEFVMDALTTSFFGSGFFAGLQNMARGGRGKKIKNGLPAYAGGGAQNGGTSVGSITLNLGGKEFTLYGERQQAKELVSIFKNMDRG